MRTISLATAGLVLLALVAVPVVADEKNPLLLGVYELERNTGVVDGDTIRCWKLDGGVRLLCVDTEETFHNLDDRREAGKGWDAYVARKAAANDLPVKYGSFMGEEAAHYAREFFRGVKSVRLEYDSATRKADIYGRHLCYAFAVPNGEKVEKNYCVELVRQGYSPYSMKYGHSTRFRKDFEAAEKEARAAKRGIWGDKPMAYPDYGKRTKWWSERAEQLERMRSKHAETANAIELTCDDTESRLGKHEGAEVILLCNMPEQKDALRPDDKPPNLRMTATRDKELLVQFESADIYTKCEPDKLRGYYVLARGKLSKNGDRGWLLVVTRVEDFAKG